MSKLTRVSFFLLFLIASVSGFAQIVNPVKWTFKIKPIGECEFEIQYKAKIDKGFHIYSQNTGNEYAVPPVFTVEKNPSIQLEKKITEPKSHLFVDPYDQTVKTNVFENEVTFRQKGKFLKVGKIIIKGSVEYIACDDKMCLPPEAPEFTLTVEGKTCATSENAPDTSNAKVDGVATIDSSNFKAPQVETQTPHVIKSTTIAPVKEKKSAWGIFIAGFLGGLIALLTPCVFPMLPLTVSFFTKQSKSRKKGIMNAFFYGASIVGIYVSLGLIITLSLGPDALNDLASNGIMNMIFFLIFVVFALSFLGAFEITLPTSWINRADSASEKGGLIGIFFMAFTLSLVSFSCTGPIIGTLLVEAAVGGNVLNPAIGMTGFSLALALPFGLFAAFPGWLNSLPKSGAWLNSVKVVLGLLELALALKFLSNVDLAYHWNFLTREIFISMWIVIFSLLGFYLLGKLKFSHDSDVPYVSVPKLILALITFSFVIYLIPGLWGAPLKLISGFPPPNYYTEGWRIGGSSDGGVASAAIPGTDPSHCPHNLSCFHDYDEALAYAKKIGKPLMVDFTGYSCVNCRKMEDNVWSDPRVLKFLREDYVLVSLYVDDKKALPAEKQYLSPTTGKKIKTIGNKWSDLQTKRFGTNSQPYYVLLDHNEELLSDPSAYDPDVENYIRFLDNGKKAFAERSKIIP